MISSRSEHKATHEALILRVDDVGCKSELKASYVDAIRPAKIGEDSSDAMIAF